MYFSTNSKALQIVQITLKTSTNIQRYFKRRFFDTLLFALWKTGRNQSKTNFELNISLQSYYLILHKSNMFVNFELLEISIKYYTLNVCSRGK